MYTYQYAALLFLAVMCFNKASLKGAFVLMVLHVFNMIVVLCNIPAESYIAYYSVMALANLFVGFVLHRKSNDTALCAYGLVVANCYGGFLWVEYIGHYSYDSICFIIIIIQLITIIPKGAVNGVGKGFFDVPCKRSWDS